ncbi:MAG: PQQ-binding-like beta-propeller repeat protein [Polyangiaceae bacterium]
MYRDMEEHPAPRVVIASQRYVYAIDARTGITAWAYQMQSHPCRVVVHGERVIIATDGELACVDYATGKTHFHIRTSITPDVTLMVDVDRIYLGAEGNVACYDMHGVQLWLNSLKTPGGVGFAVPGRGQQIDVQ